MPGIVAGAVTAAVSFALITLTYAIVDNVFLDIVSKQPDKIWGFQHSSFREMRDYVNDGLPRGVVFAVPMAAVFGAILGGIGAAFRRRLTPLRGKATT